MLHNVKLEMEKVFMVKNGLDCTFYIAKKWTKFWNLC